MNILTFTEQQVSDQITTILLGQMLDNNNAESVVQTIMAARNRGCTHVVVDCAHLEFLSSAGVGAILGTIEAFRDEGGDIILCNLSATISHVLRVLDLLDFLTVKENKQTALAACKLIQSQG